jgi:hypothetical protein
MDKTVTVKEKLISGLDTKTASGAHTAVATLLAATPPTDSEIGCLGPWEVL